MSAPDSNRAAPLSRRRLLAHGSRLAAAVTVLAAAPACAFNPLPVLPTRGMPDMPSRIAWLRRQPDGLVQLLLPRQEMGQGIAVALRQVVAEELEIEIDRVVALLPDTTQIAPVRATVGSDSIKDFAEPVARAAALLREHLREHAAGAPLEAELVDRGQPVELRSRQPGVTRRHVGLSLPTESITQIVTGAPLYAGDIRLPGMLFGLVLPADAILRDLPPGLRRIDLANGRRGLLADDPATLHVHAHAAGLAMETPARAMPSLDIDALLARGEPEHKLLKDAISAKDDWTLDRRYDIPFAAHAQIEPRAAVARWHADGAGTGPVRLEVWTGTQDAFFVRDTLARQFGLDKAAVRVQACRIGGGFGGRTIVRQELEAALLARAAGAPVKVQWSREAEFRDGFHRPPSSHRIRARLDAQGRIADWWHGFCSGHVIFTSAAMPRWMQAVTSLVADPGVARGAIPPYVAARMRVGFSDLRLPVDTGPWRGLGAGPNCFAVESAIDELAALAGQDPLAFRLTNLDPRHARLRAVFERVADLAGWHTRPRAGPGFGRGIAGGIYKETGFAAVVADVTVDAAGAVRVRRLACAHDCGQVINPDQVRAQIEGNLVWCLGMVLTESLPIEGGRVAAYTFADYAIPTLDAMPAIDIVLIEPPGAPPGGAGETAMVAAAAIGNAIAAATGRRVTMLPYKAATAPA